MIEIMLGADGRLDYAEGVARKVRRSARAYHRVLKIARTIADLAESPRVEPSHVSEAVQYRIEEGPLLWVSNLGKGPGCLCGTAGQQRGL